MLDKNIGQDLYDAYDFEIKYIVFNLKGHDSSSIIPTTKLTFLCCTAQHHHEHVSANVPAVIAYKACIKSNRNIMAELESFAEDLHILITTGRRLAIDQLNESKGNVAAFKPNPKASAEAVNGVTV